MPTDPSCIFCKIASGQIPSFKIYEDHSVLAFLDVGPLVLGHTLVIPKSHCPNILEIPPTALAAIMINIPKIAKAVLAATGAQAFHLLANNGPDALQSVPHLHFHILPRTPSDSFRIPWNAKTLEKSEGAALAQAIHAKIES